jgi:hypothetical protein
MKTLIAIQDEYIETINIAHDRWSHRKGLNGRPGGHYDRIRRGAHHKAMAALMALTFTKEQSSQILRDAEQVADLERNSEVA